MDGDSYNACLGLIEWFESVCQNIPGLDLSREAFYIQGKIVHTLPPGILRVSLKDQPSSASLLSYLRKWIEINIEFYEFNEDQVELNENLLLLSELLEREIERDMYRPFFHSVNNCSLKTNWYSAAYMQRSGTPNLVTRISSKRPTVTKKPILSVPSYAEDDVSQVRIKAKKVILNSESDDSDDEEFHVQQLLAKDPNTVKIDNGEKEKKVVKPIIRFLSKSEEPKRMEPESVPKMQSIPLLVEEKVNENTCRHRMLRILNRLKENKENELFMEPVPRSYREYYDYITHAMSFLDMYKKIEGNKYKSIQNFVKDVYLIIGNCVFYNMLCNEVMNKNREQAYSLHHQLSTLVAEIERQNSEDGVQKSKEEIATSTMYFQIIEAVYGCTHNGNQLITVFNIDSAKILPDYTRFITKAISLRSILDKMIYLQYSSLDDVAKDFNLLFDNCVIYWSKHVEDPKGNFYISSATVLKTKVNEIVKGITVTEEIKLGYERIIRKKKEKQEKMEIIKKQRLLERESASSSAALMNQGVADSFREEQEYKRLFPNTPSYLPLTRKQSRMDVPMLDRSTPMTHIPSWYSYATRCLDLLKTKSFPFWCWSIFTYSVDSLRNQLNYDEVVRQPITWMMIENNLEYFDFYQFVANVRLMFENCLAYNKPDDTGGKLTRIPCKILLKRFNELVAELPREEATKESFKEVLRQLKKQCLVPYYCYSDFEKDPDLFYPNYSIVIDHPMGFETALRCQGSFEDWCSCMHKIFDDAMRYHSNNRGNVMIHAEAEYMKEAFGQIATVAKEVYARKGDVDEITSDGVTITQDSGFVIHDIETRHKMEYAKKRNCKAALSVFAETMKDYVFDNYLYRNPDSPFLDYLKAVDRLLYIDGINNSLIYDEYESEKEFYDDVIYMLKSLFIYGNDEEQRKSILIGSEHAIDLFDDICFLYHINDGDAVMYYKKNKNYILTLQWSDTVCDDIFREFKLSLDDYQCLNYTTVAAYENADNQNKADLSSEIAVVEVDEELEKAKQVTIPSFDVWEQQLRGHVNTNNFSALFEKTFSLLFERKEQCKKCGVTRLVTIHQHALDTFCEIFLRAINPLIKRRKYKEFSEKTNKQRAESARFKEQKYGTVLGEGRGKKEDRRARSTVQLIGNLTPEQMTVYDSPSLYMLKVAKKATLRELMPELVEAEREKKESNSLKVVLSVRDNTEKKEETVEEEWIVSLPL